MIKYLSPSEVCKTTILMLISIPRYCNFSWYTIHNNFNGNLNEKKQYYNYFSVWMKSQQYCSIYLTFERGWSLQYNTFIRHNQSGNGKTRSRSWNWPVRSECNKWQWWDLHFPCVEPLIQLSNYISFRDYVILYKIPDVTSVNLDRMGERGHVMFTFSLESLRNACRNLNITGTPAFKQGTSWL